MGFLADLGGSGRGGAVRDSGVGAAEEAAEEASEGGATPPWRESTLEMPAARLDMAACSSAKMPPPPPPLRIGAGVGFFAEPCL